MARDYELEPSPTDTIPASQGKPNSPPEEAIDPLFDPGQIDKKYWERCLADAERAEQDWRVRGREIIKIYRNDGAFTNLGKRKTNSGNTFNILFSNTEVMQPAIYTKPPVPVVRSRFAKKSLPPQPVPPPAPPPLPPQAPTAGPLGTPPLPPEGASSLMMGGGGGEIALPPPPGGDLPPPPDMAMGGGPVPGTPVTPTPPPAPAPPGEPQFQDMLPPQLAPMPPGMPSQEDIDTAASVMEKALEIVLDDDVSHEAVRAAVKDVLLPGRGICRVRWKPQLESQPVEDPVMGGALTLPGEPPEELGGEPLTQDVKVWETVNDEYVYWEDILFDPVRQFADGSWIGFRHLFDKQSLLAEFPDSEQLRALEQQGKLGELLRWTEESAAKSTVGGGSPLKSAEKLGDVIKKAMAWEIWDKTNRRVIWFIRETSGLVLRVDEDTLNLSNFFPVPKPLLAVVTTDTMLPRPYFDLYDNLAADLEETSQRISRLTEKIKVRGGYNSASRDIQELLTAGDGKMIPIVGVDMLNGGLQNHIWIVPIVDWVNALKELYLAREQIKQAIYEVMGISDIMRGATNPHETATAQRIKGTMGVGRLNDQKGNVENFVRDLLRLKAEIIAKNFDADTLTKMTGEDVTPQVFEILRSDFSRTCSIDIETDSTVELDETIEQESNAKIMMAVQGVMQGTQGLLQTGVLPPPMVMNFSLELTKLMIRPIRGSRSMIELISTFQEQLNAQMMAPPPPPPGMDPAMAGGGDPGMPPGAPPGGLPPEIMAQLNGGAPMQ